MKKFVLFLSLGIISVLTFTFLWINDWEKPDLSDKKYYIAHAGGGIDGYIYTNSKEAILQSSQKGYQYIEVDLNLTADSILVLAHDWKSFNKMTQQDSSLNTVPTFEDFKQRKIQGKYTPMSVKDLLEIWKHHPFTIVTDKISDPILLNKYFTENRSSIMVEAFSDKDYFDLKTAGYLPMRAFDRITLYRNHKLLKDGTGFEWITMHANSNLFYVRILRKLYGTKIATFRDTSYDEEGFLKKHLAKDFDLIYTDTWGLTHHLK